MVVRGALFLLTLIDLSLELLVDGSVLGFLCLLEGVDVGLGRILDRSKLGVLLVEGVLDLAVDILLCLQKVLEILFHLFVLINIINLFILILLIKFKSLLRSGGSGVSIAVPGPCRTCSGIRPSAVLNRAGSIPSRP